MAIIEPVLAKSTRLRMPGTIPPTMKPRMVPRRLEDLAFSYWPAAILSLFWKQILARKKLPAESASNATGRSCSARMPGTHVGRMAMMAAADINPTILEAAPQRRAMFAAVRMSLEALLKGS